MIDAVRVCVSMKSRATRVLFTGPNKFSNGWRKSNRQSNRYDMALTDFNVQRRSGCPDGGGLMTAAVVTGADVMLCCSKFVYGSQTTRLGVGREDMRTDRGPYNAG